MIKYIIVLLLLSICISNYCNKRIEKFDEIPMNYTENLCRQFHLCKIAMDNCCKKKIYEKSKYHNNIIKIKNIMQNCTCCEDIYEIPNITGMNYLIIYPQENVNIHMTGYTFVYFEFNITIFKKFTKDVYIDKYRYKKYNPRFNKTIFKNNKKKFTIIYNYYEKNSKIKLTYY